jgi:hypothetical protein
MRCVLRDANAEVVKFLCRGKMFRMIQRCRFYSSSLVSALRLWDAIF